MPEDDPGSNRPFKDISLALTELLLRRELGSEEKVSFGNNQVFIVSFRREEVSGGLAIWIRGMPQGKLEILDGLHAEDMGGGDFAINLSVLARQLKPPPGSI